jgi:hypothetical protein
MVTAVGRTRSVTWVVVLGVFSRSPYKIVEETHARLVGSLVKPLRLAAVIGSYA